MSDLKDDPIDLEEPAGGESFEAPPNIWLRGLWMIVIGLLFGLAEAVLWVVAVVQFFWMLFAKEKNALLVDFGKDLGAWVRDAARFQSGATEDKPFPWSRWGE